MQECDYCGATHDSERAHLKHLKSEHRSELGPIDKRRVGDVSVDDGGVPTGPIALGVVILASLAVVGFVVFAGGNGGGGGDAAADGEPYNVGQVHDHGTMEAVIDGEELFFEDEEFVELDQAFHFHAGYYDRYGEQIYHLHAQGVTIQYALETLGIEVNDDGTVLEFRDETYDDGDADTSIEITVDGEAVDPGEYVLSGVGPESQAAEGEGDDLRIVVETE